MASYDRYAKFRVNGTIKKVPFIKIPIKETDYYETYVKGITRLDLLSEKYYGDPNYDWLILQANPSYGSMEFSIPDGSNLRIPYPLGLTLEQYREQITLYDNLYGL